MNSTPVRLIEAAALLDVAPRFTRGQWQRLFWDAGLKDARVHLFLRNSIPDSPWYMAVNCGGPMIDLEAFSVPLPSARFLDATVMGDGHEDAVLAAAMGHGARVEITANAGRCPPDRAADLVARTAAALLRSTHGRAWFFRPSGILASAHTVVEQVRSLPVEAVPVELYVTVRETIRAPTVVVDTLGLASFGSADLEMELDADDVPDGRAFVRGMAAAILGRGAPLAEGDVFLGPMGMAWRAELRRACVAPRRGVLRFGLAG